MSNDIAIVSYIQNKTKKKPDTDVFNNKNKNVELPHTHIWSWY